MGNVSHVMEKVEPNERQRILKELFVDSIFDAILLSQKYSAALEVEAAAVDIYVNCHPWASWEQLARSLYRHHQMAAVEEARSYLPPRGEPGCGVHVSIVCILVCIRLLTLGTCALGLQ